MNLEWSESAEIMEYWTWVLGALFLFFPADVMTTLTAASLYGIEHEANPLLRDLLHSGIVEFAGFHLIVGMTVVVLFHFFIKLIKTTPQPQKWVLKRTFEVWLGIFNSAGLFVFANNMSVIVHGHSLI